MTGFTRREFNLRALKGGVLIPSLSLAMDLLLGNESALAWETPSKGKEVAFYRGQEENEVKCTTCPNLCILADGETGLCRTRTNRGGIHINDAYGNPCILSVDPIEKLPLNNFFPGEKVVCIAVGGCNLRCLYCQNWEWSQKRPDEIKKTYDLSPDKAVDSVDKQAIKTIAFTYTDFMGFFEYACDIADIAHERGLRVISATNGFANPPAMRLGAEKMDAITVGLKGFDDTFYRTVCNASLKPVLDSILEIQSSGSCWLEITTLIVPTYNDDPRKLKEMAKWIAKNAGTKVPWHLSRFVPNYKLKNLPRTPIQTLDNAMDIAHDAGIEYVYTSNIAPHKGNNTTCPKCRRTVIERVGFRLLKNDLKDGKCKCGYSFSGHFKPDRDS